jgi:dTDP-4-amino-4,6-dideoxygalactose transaminase
MLGWNYRMTELEAALGIVQFGRMDDLNQRRIDLAEHLTERLSGIDGLTPPTTWQDCKHVFYVYSMRYDESKTGIPRDVFVNALNAEGVPFGAGYVKPLYLSPIYHDSKPFAFKHYEGHASYDRGTCPVTERLYGRELLLTPVVRPPATPADMDDVVAAIRKVLANRSECLEALATA